MRQLKRNLIRGESRHPGKFLFLAWAGLLILCLECGKKAPPVVPRPTVPPAVNDLKAEVVGDEVRLIWSVPKKGDEMFDGLKYFRVDKHRSHRSVEMCPGCPIPFEDYLEIRLDDPKPARVEGNHIVCHDKIEPDYRYAYRVVVYHKSGGASKDSNIVFVQFPMPDSQGRNSE